MRLLHTGDLHLDSAFCSYGLRDAEAQREAGRELLKRVFECAKNEKCEMILIAGDLFDSKVVTPRSGELFCSLVEKYEIPVVLSPGNHDFYFSGSFYSKAQKRLGERLFLFTTPELQIFDIDELGVRVCGYAFTGITLTESPLANADMPADNGYIKLLCAHADLSSPISRYAPITAGEIQRAGFDYAALGHIHKNAFEIYNGGMTRYCGFAEGRSFDELGEGGVWIVDVDTEGCRAERKILSSQVFIIDETEIPSYEGAESFKDALCNIIKDRKYPVATHLRLVLTGNAVSDFDINTELCDEIRKACDLEQLEIYDETLPLLDGEYLERDTTLRGEVYRSLLPKLSEGTPSERRIALKALRIALAAIDGKSVLDAGR